MKATVQSWFQHSKKAQRAFGIPFLIYFAVFATANIFDSMHAIRNDLEPAAVSTSPSKFLATTAMSTCLGVYKDGYFAKLAARAPVPLLSYCMFTARDAITVYSSFILPSLVSSKLATSGLWSLPPFCEILHSNVSTFDIAQLMMPVASQFISTPVHLLGLDINNRRIGFAISDRISQVRRHLTFATNMRIARVLPTLGVGSSLNTGCKRSMHNIGLRW